jgi:hypothetical protein
MRRSLITRKITREGSARKGGAFPHCGAAEPLKFTDYRKALIPSRPFAVAGAVVVLTVGILGVATLM